MGWIVRKRDEQGFIDENYAKQQEAASQQVPGLDMDDDLEPVSQPVIAKKRKLL